MALTDRELAEIRDAFARIEARFIALEALLIGVMDCDLSEPELPHAAELQGPLF